MDSKNNNPQIKISEDEQTEIVALNSEYQNLLLAIAAARKVGLSGKKIKDSLTNYKQLPHRMETIYKNNDNFQSE